MTTPLPQTKTSTQFEDALRAVGVWKKLNPGRLPALSRDDADEARVCMWLASQSRRSEHLSPGEVIMLNRTFPQWRRVRLEPFDIRLHEVVLFRAAHGRLPECASADEDEAALGSWLARKASRARDSTLLLRESSGLDSALPGWRECRSGRDARIVPMPVRKPRKKHSPRLTWDDRLAELTALVQDAHRPPMKDKPEEQSLARWLLAQQTAIKKGTLDYSRIHRLLLVISDTPAISFRPDSQTFSDMLERLRRAVPPGTQPLLTRLFPFPDQESKSWSEAANILFYREELTPDQIDATDRLLSDWRDYRRV